MTRIILLAAILLFSPVSSVLYSVDPSFKISYQQSANELAHCHYQEKIRESGWNRFYSYANPTKSMIDQYRGAGFLEGYATYKQIFYAYNNFYNSAVLKGDPNVNSKAQEFVDQQLDWLDIMYTNNQNDIYWQQAYALTEQLRYMYKGFLTRINLENRLDMYMGFSQFYYLTNMGDLEDIIPAFSTNSNSSDIDPRIRMNCNSFLKVLNNTIYVTQSTFNIYNLMLRFYKTYHFPSRDSRIASERIAFTSRPGDLQSKDDFYLLSSGLAVVETSLNNYDPQNYKVLKPQSVPTWLRHNVANRLAKNMKEWRDIFLRYRSYTHNNQWMVVEMNNFKDNTAPTMLIEEAFDIYAAVDVTDRLELYGYIASYNVPYTKQVWEKLKYVRYGFNYDNDPRSVIFKKYNDLIVDESTLSKYLRLNEEENKCDGIAPRCDLEPKSPFIFGMIDQKIARADVLSTNSFMAISGPPVGNGMPAFNWNMWKNEAHLGMPDQWNFQWVQLPIDYQSTMSQNFEVIE